MPLNTVIFNSVTQFVEQVEQREIWKYAELDQMTSLWNGPAVNALNFKPKVGSPHPQYPLMFCTGSDITRIEAGIAEVRATYEGVLQTSGASFYVTPPVISLSPVQGSRDFVTPWYVQTGFSTPIDLGGGASIAYPVFSAGTQTTTVRYVGTQCSIRYQVYPKPKGYRYGSVGIGQVNWAILSRTVGGMQTTLTEASADAVSALLRSITPIPALFASAMGMSAEQRGQWYNVTEVYGPTF